jgi:hypothetical protein
MIGIYELAVIGFVCLIIILGVVVGVILWRNSQKKE